MRYFSCHAGGGNIITMSEKEIYDDYYPFWTQRMLQRHSPNHLKENYSFQDCLDTWIVENSAWESTND